MNRVLYYIPGLARRWGGTERQLLNLTANLDRRRFDPLVWIAAEVGGGAEPLRRAGVPVHRVPVDVEDPVAVERVICWMRGLDARIFHSFGYGDEWFDVVFAKLAGIPVCISRRANLRHWNPERKPRFPEHLRNAGSDIVTANAQAVARLYEEVERIAPEKMRVIYNGVEQISVPQKEAARAELGLGGSDLVAGNVANARQVKGQDCLLWAFRRVADIVPNAKLVICGDGLERGDLERLRNDLELQHRVVFTGFRADVEAIYAALDLYVSPSFSEGLSNSILEAMSCGLAVVATDVGGTAEPVEAGLTGLLVPAGDAVQLSAAMIRLFQDRELRHAMGERGRARVQRDFSITRMVDEHERLYAAELARRGFL
jgi:glycosyltransferase involved in cell wall biosynthesis